MDIVSERQLERGGLRGYRLAYLVGPNLTRAAAGALGRWVRGGGTLWRAVGAGSLDEQNRAQPKPGLPSVGATTGQPLLVPARALAKARQLDRVKLTVVGGKPSRWLPVLGLKAAVPLRKGGQVWGRFVDGSPALVRHALGAGWLIDAGFLIGLAHVQPALLHRRQQAGRRGPSPGQREGWGRLSENKLHLRSRNPWRYPKATVAALTAAARLAGVKPSLGCDTRGVQLARKPAHGAAMITLANHSLQPQARVTVTIEDPRPIRRLESLYQGPLSFTRRPGGVTVSLPLGATDIIRITY